MIRNVVVGVLDPTATPEQARAALDALQALRVDGVDYVMHTGLDLGLREGNASYAITADFADEDAYRVYDADEDAYRVYDADEEHNRIRREMFAPISASIHRIQFTL